MGWSRALSFVLLLLGLEGAPALLAQEIRAFPPSGGPTSRRGPALNPAAEAAPPPPEVPVVPGTTVDRSPRPPAPVLPPLPSTTPLEIAPPAIAAPPASVDLMPEAEGFYLPQTRTLVNKTTAQRALERSQPRATLVYSAPANFTPVMATAALGPAPDHPPLLPHFTPDTARWIDLSTYGQKPAAGSRTSLAVGVDQVNAWGGRVQDSARSWTTWLAESVPWASTTVR